MDWIDPHSAAPTDLLSSVGKRKREQRKKSKRDQSPPRVPPSADLSSQLSAMLSQPVAKWTVDFEKSQSRLAWPKRCTADSSLLWSTVMLEQAEVLARAGSSIPDLASIVAEHNADDGDAEAARLAEVSGLMGQALESLAFRWIETAESYADSGLGTIGMAWHLPELARRPAHPWMSQWLRSVSERTAVYKPNTDSSVLCHLVWQCELPLWIAQATSISNPTPLPEANRAMDCLAEYLEAGLDCPAPWLLYGATYLRAALASVLRCRVLADALGFRAWYPPQQKALASLLTHAARWCRPDGTQLLAAGTRSPRSKAMWHGLLELTKKPASLMAAMSLSGCLPRRAGDGRGQVHTSRLPPVTFYSEQAAGACMQSDWRRKGSRIAVDFSDVDICLEVLGKKGIPVLAGEWTAEVEINGQSQIQLDQWQEVCWFHDDDVDYLELESQFGQLAKIQRQAILFREERLLYLADALLADVESELVLRSHLPLAEGAEFRERAEGTTDGHIVTNGGGEALVLPIYLPEWKRQLAIRGDRSGLSSARDCLQAQAVAQGRRLYMPVLISLNSSHANKPCTWRHLTVADDLRIVGPDEARAFRVQIGRDQWFAYCNLSTAMRRTALGMHTLADFFAARFDGQDGEFETLVEVEPA